MRANPRHGRCCWRRSRVTVCCAPKVCSQRSLLKPVRFNWEVAGTPHGSITGHGCLQPPLVGVPITVEVTDRRGERTLIYAVTNAQGCIDLNADLGLAPGDYQVQAFVTAGAEAAETETPPRPVRIP